MCGELLECSEEFVAFSKSTVCGNLSDQEDEGNYHLDEEVETQNNKVLPLDICKIIDDDVWWREIKQLERLLYPFCGVLNKLQAENARLHDVLHGFAYFYKI